MVALLGAVIIIVVAYLGSLYIFSKEKLPRPLRYLFFSGWEWILVGMALGPAAIGLFPETLLRSLDPFIHLGLGWVGLFFGMQLRWRDLVRVKRDHLYLTGLQALLAACAAGAVAFALVDAFYPWEKEASRQAALIIAAAASVSAPTVFALLSKQEGGEASVLRLFQVVTNLDGAIAVLAVGTAFTLLRPATLPGDALMLLAQGVAAALVAAVLFTLIPRRTFTENETLVVTFGFLLFTSGVGGVLQVSALFFNMVIGIYLANTLPKSDPFFREILVLEKPLYVVMLILAGLWFILPGGEGVALALLVVAARLAAKYAAVRWGAPVFGIRRLPLRAGFLLSSQGAMAMAVGFTLLAGYHGLASRQVFSVIVLCIMVNEILAPYLVSGALQRSRS